MDAATRESMASSQRNDWGTPPEVLDFVYQMGDIELDPAANLRSAVRCNQHIALPEDGLVASWSGRLPTHHAASCLFLGACSWICRPEGLIFLNPPYGRQVKKWVEKCVHEAKQGCEIIALVAARVDTKWFQENIFAHANAVCFWKGRIKFVDLSTGEQGDPAFFPSAIVYYGKDTARFVEIFGDQGHTVVLR